MAGYKVMVGDGDMTGDGPGHGDMTGDDGDIAGCKADKGDMAANGHAAGDAVDTAGRRCGHDR